MKIPLLILCLAVYGSCRMYDEKNVDVVKEIQNNEDYKMNIANVPFERFLARHKRASLLSPITTPIDMTLHLLDSLMSTIVNFMKPTFGALTERNLCSKVENLSIELIPKAMLEHPIETIRIIVCHIFQVMGTQGQTLITKAFQLFRQFFRNVFLPVLHTTLNELKKTGLLPREIIAIIDMFDVMYKVMQITGYIH